MSKALYLVNVVREGREQEYEMLCKDGLIPDVHDASPDAAGFVEAVRASNRREAMVLAQRKYPDRIVLSNVVKA
jgi:hypothetical protein